MIVYDFDEDSTLPVARGFVEKGLDLQFIKNPKRGGCRKWHKDRIERGKRGLSTVEHGGPFR